jgi:hypothetical protein
MKMGWRYVTYEENGKVIVFTIQPMVGQVDIVFLPDQERWEKTALQWSKTRRGSSCQMKPFTEKVKGLFIQVP